MDNPYPLESLSFYGNSSSDEEEEEEWDMHSKVIRKSDVFGTTRTAPSFFNRF
jgi:hypothetical protein